MISGHVPLTTTLVSRFLPTSPKHKSCLENFHLPQFQLMLPLQFPSFHLTLHLQTPPVNITLVLPSTPVVFMIPPCLLLTTLALMLALESLSLVWYLLTSLLPPLLHCLPLPHMFLTSLHMNSLSSYYQNQIPPFLPFVTLLPCSSSLLTRHHHNSMDSPTSTMVTTTLQIFVSHRFLHHLSNTNSSCLGIMLPSLPLVTWITLSTNSELSALKSLVTWPRL